GRSRTRQRAGRAQRPARTLHLRRAPARRPSLDPTGMNPTTLLLLLPGEADTAAPWLRIDPAGHVLERGLATPDHPMPASLTGSRQVLAVPGAATSVHWLELPARNPVQALAAARLLLADDIAGARDGLH